MGFFCGGMSLLFSSRASQPCRAGMRLWLLLGMPLFASSAVSLGAQGLGSRCLRAVGIGALYLGPVGMVGRSAVGPAGSDVHCVWGCRHVHRTFHYVHSPPESLSVSVGPSTPPPELGRLGAEKTRSAAAGEFPQQP